MRMVVDLSDFDGSRWVNSDRPVGPRLRPNYTDQIDAWAANESFPWPFTEAAVREAAQAELTLKPPGATP